MTGNGQQLTYLGAFISISIFYAFLQVAAEKKYSKNGAAGNLFGPSYFVTALCSKY